MGLSLGSCALRVSRAIAVAAVAFCAVTVSAQPVVIEGRFDPAEWAAATTYTFPVNLPGGGTTLGRLYMTNDGVNVYACMRVKEPALRAGQSFSITFDADRDEAMSATDDAIVVSLTGDACARVKAFSDDFLYVGGLCPAGSICVDFDMNAGGTSDGGGAVDNDGTYTNFEVWHPLWSGDIHDMRFGLSSEIRFKVAVSLGFPGGARPTDYPIPAVFDLYVTH